MPKHKRRKTKWNTSHISIMKKGIYLFRHNIINSVQIERKLKIPPRTLRRYVAFSRDPESKFYLEETDKEKLMRKASTMSYDELMKNYMRKIDEERSKIDKKPIPKEEPDIPFNNFHDMKVEMLDPSLLDINLLI